MTSILLPYDRKKTQQLHVWWKTGRGELQLMDCGDDLREELMAQECLMGRLVSEDWTMCVGHAETIKGRPPTKDSR